jgi:hypothetical protein
MYLFKTLSVEDLVHIWKDANRCEIKSVPEAEWNCRCAPASLGLAFLLPLFVDLRSGLRALAVLPPAFLLLSSGLPSLARLVVVLDDLYPILDIAPCDRLVEHLNPHRHEPQRLGPMQHHVVFIHHHPVQLLLLVHDEYVESLTYGQLGRHEYQQCCPLHPAARPYVRTDPHLGATHLHVVLQRHQRRHVPIQTPSHTYKAIPTSCY